MAEGAANVVIEKLGASLCERVKLCRDVHREARNLKDDVESMQSFLRAASRSSNDDDDTVKTSVKRAREAVCDAEDVLDEYKLRLEVNREPGFLGLLRRTARGIRHLKPRLQIASEIQDIRAKIRDIPVERRDNQLSAAERGLGNSQASDSRMDALFVAESELVGIDVPRNLLIQKLSWREQSLMTIAVVGMGGLGKTTLVRKVYEQAKRGDPSQFETYAWIPVSQKFQVTDILRKMIAQFCKAKTDQANDEQAPSGVDAMTEMELIECIVAYLGNKRFLLVLDDVWGVDAWTSLKSALPDWKNGSRVLITTRIKDVAVCSARPSNCILNLRPLRPKDAWSLFCRKAFRSNEENCCPPCLHKLAKSFVQKCRGLPLAIVSLGSLLYAKAQAEWEMIHRSLGPEFETDDHLKRMKDILLLSFEDLPYYLRSCFLYLSIFPEDYRIKRMKLIRLWIAEGLIESKRGRSLEEVADGYLHQLIRRSLIQVVEWKHYETVKTCQLHDMVREIIIPKYEEEGFFSSSSSIELEATPSNRILRRLSVDSGGGTNQRYEHFRRLHSLFIFGVDNALAIASFAKLRYLRVLDLENLAMESFPDDLTELLFLRFLSLENTNIKKLTNSVGKLKHLETLNLKGTLVRELPTAILQLESLRHLLVYKYGQGTSPFTSTGGVKVPPGIGNLRSLQKLGHIEAESVVVTELGNLTVLRRLGVIKLRREDGSHFCTSVAQMSHLESLDVKSVDEDVVLDLQSLSCQTLQRLYLCTRLENLPQCIPTLEQLVYLSLIYSRLKDDPLKALQSLPNLVYLELKNAYDGEELCCDTRGYPKLKELHLRNLIGLKQVKVENGAMSNLVDFRITNCGHFEEVPSWLQQLTKMKFLRASGMPEKFKQSLHKDGGEELIDCVKHIPCILIFR